MARSHGGCGSGGGQHMAVPQPDSTGATCNPFFNDNVAGPHETLAGCIELRITQLMEAGVCVDGDSMPLVEHAHYIFKYLR